MDKHPVLNHMKARTSTLWPTDAVSAAVASFVCLCISFFLIVVAWDYSISANWMQAFTHVIGDGGKLAQIALWAVIGAWAIYVAVYAFCEHGTDTNTHVR